MGRLYCTTDRDNARPSNCRLERHSSKRGRRSECDRGRAGAENREFMSPKSANKSVIAICIQEPAEDGSKFDLGAITGDDLRFIHQAFITDTIINALSVPSADVRLYHIKDAARKRLVGIVQDYLAKKLTGKKAERFKDGYSTHEQPKERWGLRIEQVFEECFAAGYNNVLVVGSRTPTVTPNMLKTALRVLDKSDAVFGPTPEGRYYTIGMSGSYRIRLSDFDWKSPRIYSDVASAFTESKLSWSELEIWYTIETSDELEIMARDINQFRFEGNEETARETELVMERLISKLEP
ncbi:DUF2064 domain-containing protein [candidate division GN15 bacterium]|nr:DUF2064 domain-containing protein [candidate division GN15 bacterium]